MVVIELLLPAGVASAEAFTDPPEAAPLPEEAAFVANAVDKRRREFVTARWCARRALVDLGLAPAPILPGPHGAPRWPDSVIGSITHCAGYRAAALAHAGDLPLLGIDAEPDEPLPTGVLDSIALVSERNRVHRMARSHPGTHWDRLLFSAKETVYKGWFPMAGERLGFEDADIRFDVSGTASGTFTARILAGASTTGSLPRHVLGRWAAKNGLLVTAGTEVA